MTARLALVAALLTAGCSKRQPPQVVAEVEKRNAFVRALSEREGHLDAWSLNSRHDLSFEDGMSNPTFIDEEPLEPKWFETTRISEIVPGKAVRWLNRNAHFRARGDADMVFAIRGKLNVNQIFTQPRLELIVDGAVVVSQLLAEDGRFAVSAAVPRAAITDWIDIYVTFSALQEPERAPGEPWVARLELVEWKPAHAGTP